MVAVYKFVSVYLIDQYQTHKFCKLQMSWILNIDVVKEQCFMNFFLLSVGQYSKSEKNLNHIFISPYSAFITHRNFVLTGLYFINWSYFSSNTNTDIQSFPNKAYAWTCLDAQFYNAT